MNREILFKAKRADNGEWIEGYGVVLIPNLASIIHRQGINLMHHTEVIPSTVCQFTGRYDDNDIKVFEGDKCYDILNNVLTVEWNDDTCQWQFDDGTPINNEERYGCYISVFSNIHDEVKP